MIIDKDPVVDFHWWAKARSFIFLSPALKGGGIHARQFRAKQFRVRILREGQLLQDNSCKAIQSEAIQIGVIQALAFELPWPSGQG